MADTNEMEVVTLVIKHRVKAGFEAAYKTWLRNIVRIAGQWEGHLGVDVVPGKQSGLDTYTCILRFCSTDAMQRWLDSPQRRELVNEALPMLADGDQTAITIRIPKNLKEAAVEAAELKGMSFSAYIRNCLIADLSSGR